MTRPHHAHTDREGCRGVAEHRPTPRRRGRAMSAFALIAAASVAVSAAAAQATAEPIADTERTTVTADGWALTVAKTAETIDRVPNLAATPFSREGFVDLGARAVVEGTGTAPEAILRIGYQIGCQVDVSTGLTLGVATTLGANAGVTIGVPAPGGPGGPGGPGLNVGATASITPSMSTTIKPGSIESFQLAEKRLDGTSAAIMLEQAHVKVDGCAGPVTLRSYATLHSSTAAADHTVTTYGAPISL
ncbi:MspA family porin [Nocardia cyriacigeorgica]|uniref:MspA family porin n=1 Tax=Nocardia cyriacigeorgica TaxID=135487 RepID=UPI0035159BB1